MHLRSLLAVGGQEAGQHTIALLLQDVIHLAMCAAYVRQQWSLGLEDLVAHLAFEFVRRKLGLCGKDIT